MRLGAVSAASKFHKGEADLSRDEWLRSDLGRACVNGDLEAVRGLVYTAAAKASDAAQGEDGEEDEEDEEDRVERERMQARRAKMAEEGEEELAHRADVNHDVTADMLEASKTDVERKKLQRMRPKDRRKWRKRRAAQLYAKMPDIYGETALHISAAYGHERLLKYLVESLSVPVDEPNKEGMTPFLIACARGNLECARFLFRNGASDGPNPQQEHTCARAEFSGATALHLAASSGNSKLVQWLTTPAGGSVHPSWKDDWDRTAVEMAATADVVDVLEEVTRELARLDDEAAKAAATARAAAAAAAAAVGEIVQ